MKIENSRQSIVVVGEMNPAIHSPQWYQLIDLLSEAEVSNAVEREVIITSQAAEFSFGDIAIQCVGGRWQVRAPVAEFDRCVALAIGVFRRLFDTPIGAFGYNFDVLVETDNALARQSALRQLAATVGVDEELTRAQLKFTIDLEERALNATLFPSPDHNRAIVASYNYHYSIPSATEVGLRHFDLGERIIATIQRDRADFHNRVSRHVAALTK